MKIVLVRQSKCDLSLDLDDEAKALSAEELLSFFQDAVMHLRNEILSLELVE
jgi:hypothetical protein